eukprot:361405-Chlamydomonas_euryale.AAC.6
MLTGTSWPASPSCSRAHDGMCASYPAPFTPARAGKTPTSTLACTSNTSSRCDGGGATWLLPTVHGCGVRFAHCEWPGRWKAWAPAPSGEADCDPPGSPSTSERVPPGNASMLQMPCASAAMVASCRTTRRVRSCSHAHTCVDTCMYTRPSASTSSSTRGGGGGPAGA